MMKIQLRSIGLVSRKFHASALQLAKVGEKISSIQVFEGAPSNNVDISSVLAKGKHLLLGVPGAFSPGCSARHLPEYFQLASKFQDKGVTTFNVVVVNDAFVTKSWNEALVDKHGAKQFRFFADPKGDFVKQMDLDFDATSIFGNHRSKRFAAVVEDGVISKLFIEPDNTGIDVSAAENVLKEL